LFVLLAASLAGIPFSLTAKADTLDLTKQCSLTVEVKYGGTVFKGVKITVYQAAQMTYSGSGFLYDISKTDFAKSSVDLGNIETASENLSQAAALMKYAISHNISGLSASTNANGDALFSNLSPGLYLISIGSISGYYDMAPYLVSVPELGSDGKWAYAVIAYPKTEPIPIPTPPPSLPPVPTPTISPRPVPTPTIPPRPTPTPTVPPTPIPSSTPGMIPSAPPPYPQPSYTAPANPPTAGVNPTAPPSYTVRPAPTPSPEGKLPQTGMLNWPIPVMSVAGMFLFALGGLMFKKKSESNDKDDPDK